MYPMDSVIHLLNNWGIMISNEVAATLCIKSQRFFCLFTGWVNQVSHFVKVINIKFLIYLNVRERFNTWKIITVVAGLIAPWKEDCTSIAEVRIPFNPDFLFQACLSTIKPRCNKPLYGKVLVITNGFHYHTYSKIYGKKPRYSECTFCQSLGSSLYRGSTVRHSDDLLYIEFSFFSTEREQEEMTDEFQLFKAISTRQTEKNLFLSW